MRVFLLDLWLDLREKRLAPVAVLLLAGIIAVPIVLANSAEEPAPPPQQPTTAAATPGAAVVSGQTEEGPVESKLQTFSPRDPFEPTGRIPTPTVGGTDTATAGGTTPTTDPGTGTAGGGDPGAGGTVGTEPGTGTGGTGNTGGSTGETRTRVFTYTVDLRFGEAGDMDAYRKVQRLDLIPNADDPKLVFLGVTTTARTAVFLVDSNIGVDTGEGRCRPSPDECTFLYLRPDADHDQARLTDEEGTVFNLRLLDIDRVAVSSADGGSGGNTDGGETRSDRAPAFTGSAKSDEETVPGDSPPGEPGKPSSFQQFFADSSASDSE